MLNGDLAAGAHRQIWERSGMLVSPEAQLSSYYLTNFSALADADPLGVNQNVTFDEVGGLDDRECCFFISYLTPHYNLPQDIHALKEMTLLPLL